MVFKLTFGNFSKKSSRKSKKKENDFEYKLMLIFGGFILLIILAFVTGFFKVEDFFCFIKNSGAVGVVGLFFVSIIANASLFFPLPLDIFLAPISVVEFLNLGIFSPLLLGVVVALGASFGEFSGYIIGYLGITTFNKMKKSEIAQLKILKDQLNKVGIPLLVVFAFTPLPFDVIGLAAGLARYSKIKFFVGCFIGKIMRYVLIAYAGYFGAAFILSLFGIPADYLAMSCVQAVV